MKQFEWVTPDGIAHAARAATATVASAMLSRSGQPATDAAVLKAGGIDLLDLMKEGLLSPHRLINLLAIPGLDRIEPQEGGVRMGPNVTLAQLAAHEAVRARYRALADAAGASASPQIRHSATLAGNLLQRPRCWYFRSRAHHCARKGGDTCFAFAGENQYHAIFDHRGCAIVHPSTCATALVAFGAALEITDPTGARREVGLEAFLRLPQTDLQRENDLLPGEIVTAIRIPAHPQTTRSILLKQGETESFDWPVAEVAVALDLADGVCRSASVVLGAAAPVPHRATQAEATLAGRAIDEALLRAAARAALEGAAPLSRNAYKLPIFEALVRRAIRAAAAA
jgi:xanthine dehydrogenase YagS FAD-binding subunit